MSASGPIQTNVIKRMNDEDRTAELFTSYLHAASSILGEHKSMVGRTFSDIEEREHRIRKVLRGMSCTAFRPWGNHRFGSFGLFARDGPSRQGRGEVWKVMAPEGVLRAIASRHEAKSNKNAKRKANGDVAAKRHQTASAGSDGHHAIQQESTATSAFPLFTPSLPAASCLAASPPVASLQVAQKISSATAGPAQPIRPTTPGPAQQEDAQRHTTDGLHRAFPMVDVVVLDAILMASGGDIARARDALRHLSAAQPEQVVRPVVPNAGSELGQGVAAVESNEAFARDLQAELNGRK